MPHTPSPLPARKRRRGIIALVCCAILLIPVAQLYRAYRTASAKPQASWPPVTSHPLVAKTLTVSASAGHPAEARPEPAARAGVDASNFYKDAFVLYAALSDEEKKMFRQPLEETDADKAAALFKKIQPIMELLHQAAAADYCEWGLGPIEFDTSLPHITKSVELCRVAHWSADYRFPSDPKGAFADLTTQARLGDHLADTDVGWAVQMAMESGANEVLRKNAGTLDPAGLQRARDFIQASSVPKNDTRAFAWLNKFVETFSASLAKKNPEDRWQRLVDGANGRPLETEFPTLRGMLRDDASVLAEVQYMQEVEKKMVASASQPVAEFDAWWKTVESSLSEHPLTKMCLSYAAGFRNALQRNEVKRTMLDAGLALLQSGPEQLAQFRDPASGAAFAYVAKPDGFELRSTLKANDKPVTMSFTRP